ncbi:MAG TPA: FAD-dependent oxidoreductase, partial [Phycisphaeraceae bacterium]
MTDDLNADVVVIGGGPAGVAAALAAAQNQARTILVESSPMVGGNAISGLPLLGCCNSLGQWIVGGVLNDLLNGCKRLGGYIGAICDWRTLYGVCVSPDILRLVMIERLAQLGVRVLLYTRIDAVETDGGYVESLIASNKRGRFRVRAP